ncbi:tyrosine-type recombinase/integrase [Escherichia coli]|uniref:tyrosine-type recombinase/integrase n=1 Tax=Escherichia coli TaxID=562 RepID=UPI00388FDF53
MSRNTLNKLTDRQCKAAKPRDKTYKLSDGGGLYLEVSQTGSKYWRMKYRRPSDKKEDRLAFGVYPTISLQDARAKRDNAKKLLVKGIDPKAEQRAAKAEEKGAFTFETIGRQWVESHQMWNEAHRKRVLRSLEMYIFPHIGTSDIRKLEAMTILPLFKKVDDAGKHDTANYKAKRQIQRTLKRQDINRSPITPFQAPLISKHDWDLSVIAVTKEAETERRELLSSQIINSNKVQTHPLLRMLRKARVRASRARRESGGYDHYY